MKHETAYSYYLLPNSEQQRIAALWSDGLNPADFLYSMDAAGHVVGRSSITGAVDPAPLPQPVRSSRKTHQLTDMQKAKRLVQELLAPLPGQRRRRARNQGFVYHLLTLLALALISSRKG